MDGLVMKYFILKPKAKDRADVYALASRMAMLAYAGAVQSENPQLAKELVGWVTREEEKTQLITPE